MPTPKNQQLYETVKKQADRIYKTHSLFKSAYIQKEYKARGGQYSNDKPTNTGVNRWLKKEDWVAVIPYIEQNREIECGSLSGKMIACRPLIRASEQTPITLPEAIKKHGAAKVLALAKKKERNPKIRIDWVNAS